MSNHQDKLRLLIHAIFILAALIVLVDFTLPGRIINDKIIEVKKERQQYYNAARNYHYSYKLHAHQHQFSVAEDFAELIQDEEKVEYSVSRIFKEVNWYRIPSSENKDVFSLRILSGLALPLLTIVPILVAHLYKKNMGILLFVLQVLLLADLILLMA